MQLVIDGQDTLDRLLRVTSAGTWVGLTLQLVPFQPSSRGRVTPLRKTDPTAWHPAWPGVVLQDTPENSLSFPEGTFTLCGVQATVPFQLSASGTTLVPAQ